MSHEKLTDDQMLTDAEATALDADFALLMRDDPAPALSAVLSGRILADAADAVPVVEYAVGRPSNPKPGFGAAFRRFWQPLSAGLAAAALGVWLGWADPAGVTLYAGSFMTADLADFDSEFTEPADHFDLEL